MNKKETINNDHQDIILEHIVYKIIPGTKNSYRKDNGNIDIKTQEHVHVYAKKDGNGKELYAVNIDGSGHDGSSGKKIPDKHAEFLRGKGYDIKEDCILECINYSENKNNTFIIFL